MRRAIEIARRNPDAPFGCVVVDRESGGIAAEGINRAEGNPILHGEISALLDLAGSEDNSRLVLYSTAEPCPMCAGAILWSGVPSVVLGSNLGTLKRLGLPHVDLPCDEVASRARSGGFGVVRGVLEDECDALFREMARRMQR